MHHPFFPLKWTKKRSPFCGTDNQRNNDIDDSDFGIYHPIFLSKFCLISEYKDAILEYIGGYVVRKIMNDIECEICAASLVNGDENKMAVSYLSLVSVKNRGGLVFPSSDVVKIMKVCEIAFKGHCAGDDFRNPKMSSCKNQR